MGRRLSNVGDAKNDDEGGKGEGGGGMSSERNDNAKSSVVVLDDEDAVSEVPEWVVSSCWWRCSRSFVG